MISTGLMMGLSIWVLILSISIIVDVEKDEEEEAAEDEYADDVFTEHNLRVHPRLCAASPFKVETEKVLHKLHKNPCFLK